MAAPSLRDDRYGSSIVAGAILVVWPVLAFLSALAMSATHSLAQDTPSLDAIEQTIESERDRAAELERQSEALAAELAGLRERLIGTAAAMQDHEERLSAFESSMQSLEEAIATVEQRLIADRTSAVATLAALQRLALTPPQTALFAAGDPIDRARAAALLESTYPRLAAHAARMRDDLDELATLRQTIEAQRAAAAETAATLAGETDELAVLVERKQALLAQTAAARAETDTRIAQLAADAADLKDLIARLNSSPPAEKPEPADARLAALPGAGAGAAIANDLAPELQPFPASPGGLLLPVRGTVTLPYGAVDADGEASRGIVIETRPGAQVVVPFDGRIAYAGPFRGYGLILIVEHGDGYHSLLAGLGRVDAQVGQWVLAGEPAGVMPGGTAKNPALYIELRRTGQPIDPAPWFGLIAGG